MTTFIILGVVATLFVLLSLAAFIVNKSVNKSFAFSLNEITFTDEDVMYDLVYKKAIDRNSYQEE